MPISPEMLYPMPGQPRLAFLKNFFILLNIVGCD